MIWVMAVSDRWCGGGLWRDGWFAVGVRGVSRSGRWKRSWTGGELTGEISRGWGMVKVLVGLFMALMLVVLRDLVDTGHYGPAAALAVVMICSEIRRLKD